MNLRGSEKLSSHFVLFASPQKKKINYNVDVKTAWRFTSEPLLHLHGVMLSLRSRFIVQS
jgi:hypothetical protein